MENIKAHLDGQLNATDASAVETHLESVPDLKEMRDQFVLITNTLKTTETGEPYGQEKLFERLASTTASNKAADRKLWRTATGWSLGSAFIVLMALPIMNGGFGGGAAESANLSMKALKSEAVASSVPTEQSKSRLSPNVERSGQGLVGAPGSMDPAADSIADRSQSSIDGQLYQNPAQAAAKSKGGFGSSAPERESQFKGEMRNLRDRNVNGTISLNQPMDTPKGIYLERSGDVKVKVEDVGRSVNEATGLAQSLGGFVINTNVANGADGGIGTITLRVPTKSFVTAMQKIEEMGERISSNSTSNDITDETVTESTSMISWADEEARLIKELNASRDRDEKWRLRQQLSQVRVNLQVHRANVKSLKERGEFSTIAAQFLSGDKADATTGGSSNWSGNAL
ncbi:MAG TPA: DUF4349 domain-containing protein, partial [Fimbriimonas sp.]|nr:DUF4349 domain-containing protein [Fimbriimonas sp.]